MALLKVRWTGVSPLMMHNDTLSDALSDHSKALKVITGKRKKVDEDHIAMSRVEFFGGMYHDDKLGPYIQGIAILACIRDAAKESKKGKLVKESLLVTEMKVPLKYAGPRTPQEMWDARTFVDRRSVVVMGKRVMRTRPIFHEWSLSFTLDFASDRIDKADLIAWMDTAGQYKGLGDYRPFHGRFSVDTL
jgi:hypothetical protein